MLPCGAGSGGVVSLGTWPGLQYFQSRPAQLVDGAHLYLQRAYLCGATSAVTCCLLLQVAHAAVALMDATVAAGGRPSDALEGLFIAACLRIAAANEGGYVPTPDEAAVLFGSNGAVFSRRQHAKGFAAASTCPRLCGSSPAAVAVLSATPLAGHAMRSTQQSGCSSTT